ncbi:MAG: ACP S-malonyltransferase [Moraxella sp.]|nr:ACP S-malonyltransferase [Moraxella sp.]
MTTATQLPRFAFIFPGQGSQALGMMSEMTDFDEVQTTFDEASSALGVDLWALTTDETKLHDTQYTQPVLLTASIAIWRILEKRLPVKPVCLAGHSLGEYSALCAAGVLSLADAVKLVHERGRLMSKAVLGMDTQMAAVLGMEDEQVVTLAEQISESVGVVDAANFNSPGQVVVAGTALGVSALLEEVQALGKKAVPLKVSVPSHCQLMKPASEALATLLESTEFHQPSIHVIQNRHARVEVSLEDIKLALTEQLSHPVKWTQTMDKLASKQLDFVVECGFGNVLTNLAKRQAEPLPAFATDKPVRLDKLMEQFDES